MGSITYNLRAEYAGPWLIDSRQLDELEKKISLICDDLLIYRERYIESEAKKMTDIHFECYLEKTDELKKKIYEEKRREIQDRCQLNKEIIFGLDDGREYNTDSIEDAKNSLKIKHELILYTIISISVSSLNVEVKLTINSKKALLECYPFRDEHLNKSFGIMASWLEDNGPSILIKIFNKLSKLFLLITAIAVSLSFAIIFDIFNSVKLSLKNDAAKLLADKIGDSNIHQAIELILRAEFLIPTSKYDISLFYVSAFIALIFILLYAIFEYKPSFALELGIKKWRVKSWRWTIQLICWSLPIFLLITVIRFFINSALSKGLV